MTECRLKMKTTNRLKTFTNRLQRMRYVTYNPGRVLYQNFYFKTMLFNYVTVCDYKNNLPTRKMSDVAISNETFLDRDVNNNLFLYYSAITYSTTRHFAIYVRYTLEHHRVIYEDELSETIISTTIPTNIELRGILLIHCCS